MGPDSAYVWESLIVVCYELGPDCPQAAPWLFIAGLGIIWAMGAYRKMISKERDDSDE